MIGERFKPDSDVVETREVRVDIPRIGPKRMTAEIIDGMAVVEGDIVLGPADEFTDVSEADSPDDVAESVGLRNQSAFWSDGEVPYEIEPNFPREHRIHDAIEHWETNTPIRFVERTNENDYVRFFDGDGCWSRIGRQGGEQKISIDGGCGTGTTIHEIAHALGFWHEQSRSDRDVYITVNWENIEEGKEGNFKKHEGANDIGEYDYDSIMHYGAYYFSTGGKTIEAPEPIGQRQGLSAGDIEAVYRVYGPTDAGSIRGVTDDWDTMVFDSDVSPDPVVITRVQSFNGNNTVDVRMRNLGNGSADVFLEEEQSKDSETTHVTEEVGYFATEAGEIYDENAELIGGADTVTVGQAGNNWITLVYDPSISDPVVFMQLQSYNGSHPAHIRVRDVGSGRFRFQIEEWDYLDQDHTTEEVGCLVLESGTHTLQNGIELDVGTVDGDDHWTTVSTNAPTDPVVISQCQTFNGSHEVVTRHRNVGRGSFDVRLQEEEGRNQRHTTERIGYASISPPLEFEFGVAQEAVNHKWDPLDYASDFHSTPATVASVATYNGQNTADVRIRNPDREGVQIQIEEEKSEDSETSHKSERVAYVSAPEGPVTLPRGDTIGESETVTQNQPAPSKWYTATFDEDYHSGAPVVFAQVMTKNGPRPAHVRLRDVTTDDFEYQIEEWGYLNEKHVQELLGYVALEPGVHQLPDGRLIEVGTTRTNHSWTSVALDPRLHGGDAVDATVVTRCQTYNGHQSAVTRQRDVSPTGFDVRLQEQDANRRRHRTETIGYVAGVR